ncbi:hypothetical protein, partial [Parabacteroides sp. FAFU027]|uniref:hypothetical protein n=1 Tax=Parabacteroides sp. FAFU027 TaxID=2922715 RepID=UPI001FAE98C8
FTSALQNPSIPNVTLANAGTYKVIVTNAAGCVDSITTNVVINALPTPTIGSNTPVCVGKTLNLTSGGGTSYLWKGPNGFTSALQNPSIPNVTLANAGTYKVIVTNAAGCVDSITTNVVINALPTPTIGSNTPVCVGKTLNLTSGGGTSYQWKGPNGFTSALQNPSIPNVTLANAGTYKVIVTNAAGCVDSITTNVVINALPTPTIGSNSPICVGMTLNLTSGGGTSYLWKGPNGFTSALQNPSIPNVTLANAGTYKVIVTNAAGCVDSITTKVDIEPLPVLVTHNPSAVCYPFTVDLTDPAVTDGSTLYGATLTYFYENGTTPLLHPEAVSESGIYQIKATTPYGCTDMKPVSVTIENCLTSYCSLTQGFYGNQKGKFCDGTPGYTLVQNLLNTPIVIGISPRLFTIDAGNAACVRSILPGGGTPAVIPIGPWSCGNLGSVPGPLLTKQGRLNNILLAQTITLALNLRLDPNLGTVNIYNQSFYTRGAAGCSLALPNYPLGDAVTYTIPNAVWSHFTPPFTVTDILKLASDALGGANTGVSLSAINNAVSMFNEAADECQYIFFPPAVRSATATSDAPSIIPTESGNITVQVVPNPFKAFTEVQVMSPVNSSTARVDIYDLTGRLITSYVGDGLEAGVTKSFMILDSDLAANQSIFICVVRTDQGSVSKRIIRLF